MIQNILDNDPNLKLWVLIALSAVISILMFSNYGETLVSNAYKNSQKGDIFDHKKLSRVIGTSMAVLAVILLFMKVFGSMIPGSYIKVFVVLILTDLFAAIIFAYTKCMKAEEQKTELPPDQRKL
ncbi:MAG: DUF3784 domain-containing protein [Oscillospiraceae bacterium]|nr:DUF3784 domain-containing protein [Oscillospiraceae bacterium]